MNEDFVQKAIEKAEEEDQRRMLDAVVRVEGTKILVKAGLQVDDNGVALLWDSITIRANRHHYFVVKDHDLGARMPSDFELIPFDADDLALEIGKAIVKLRKMRAAS